MIFSFLEPEKLQKLTLKQQLKSQVIELGNAVFGEKLIAWGYNLGLRAFVSHVIIKIMTSVLCLSGDFRRL